MRAASSTHTSQRASRRVGAQKEQCAYDKLSLLGVRIFRSLARLHTSVCGAHKRDQDDNTVAAGTTVKSEEAIRAAALLLVSSSQLVCLYYASQLYVAHGSNTLAARVYGCVRPRPLSLA